MTDVVTACRDAIRIALASAFPGVTWGKAYWRSVSAEKLPIGAVYTSTVEVDRFDANCVSRVPDIKVLVKKTGGDDLEDDMFAAAADIEVVVLEVLDGLTFDFDLTQVEVTVDGSADSAVGMMVLTFRAVLLTPFGQPEVSTA